MSKRKGAAGPEGDVQPSEPVLRLSGDVPPSALWQISRLAGHLAARYGFSASLEPDTINQLALHDPRGLTAHEFRGASGPKDEGMRIWRALRRGSSEWRNGSRPYYKEFAREVDAVNEPGGLVFMPRDILQTLVDEYRGPYDKIPVHGIDRQSIDFIQKVLDTYLPAPDEPPVGGLAGE